MIRSVVGYAFKVLLDEGAEVPEVVVVAADAIEAAQIVRDRYDGVVIGVERVIEVDIIDDDVAGEEAPLA